MKSYLAAVVAVLSVGACGGAQTGGNTGALRVQLRNSALVQQPDIQCVSAHVYGAGLDVAGILSNSDPGNADGVWQLRMESVPVGDVTLEVHAFKTSGCNYSTQGWAYGDTQTVHVTPQGVDVVLLLQQVIPAQAFQNNAPYIRSFTVNSATIIPGATIDLHVTALDSDNDALTYAWSSDNGQYPAGDAQGNATWTAGAAGTYTLAVTVSDGKGGSATATISIDVNDKYATGTIQASIDMNNWPQVQRIDAANTNGDANSVFQLEAVATDADNDSLTYAWGADCAPGWEATGASIMFTPANATFSGTCTLTVTVSDGRHGTGTGSIALTITPVRPAVGPQFMVRWLSPFSMINPDGIKRAEIAVIPTTASDLTNKTFDWYIDGVNYNDVYFIPYDGPNPNGDHSDVWFTVPACGTAFIPANAVTDLPITVVVTDTSTGASNSAVTHMAITCQQ